MTSKAGAVTKLVIAVDTSLRRLTSAERELLLVREPADDPSIRDRVRGILEEVQGRGDSALHQMAVDFDGVALNQLEVDRAHWKTALDRLQTDVRAALERSIMNIRSFHRALLPPDVQMETEPGITIGRRHVPLQRVGVYAPGGRAAYPSSVLMGVIPAKVAGVDEVVVFSPPGSNERPPDVVMAAAELAGAERLFAVGGAGAVAAAVFGTQSIPRCDAIVGPGNRYVIEAKRQLAGRVVIDSPAGPSEVLVVADKTANPAFVAGELIAQAEHDPDAAVALVTADPVLLKKVRDTLARLAIASPRWDVVQAALATRGALVLTETHPEALEFAQDFAAEHLALYTANPERDLDSIRSAGTVLLGDASSVVHGDYMSGANHVLPTAGASRTFSGLSTQHFLRAYTWQKITPEAAAGMADDVACLANSEGLPAHGAAALMRAQSPGDTR